MQAFQSPYWAKLPVDNGPLLTRAARRGVTHVWLNHWAGLPVMFDARVAGQPLIAYDWYDVEAGGIDRFPEYRALLERAERPAFVLVTDEEEPELVRRLRSRSGCRMRCERGRRTWWSCPPRGACTRRKWRLGAGLSVLVARSQWEAWGKFLPVGPADRTADLMWRRYSTSQSRYRTSPRATANRSGNWLLPWPSRI